MKKSLLLVLLFAGLCFKLSYSQAPLAATNPNFVHDKITNLSIISQKVQLPDSVYRILKEFAILKNKNIGSVTRSDYMFKVLYNKDLSTEDKLFACRFYINANSGQFEHVPLYFLKHIELKLNSN